jgi:RNA polymerase sigma-32 factor
MTDHKKQNAELISRYKETGDNKILGQLVKANYSLVVGLSKKFHVKSYNQEDLIQKGCIGLIHAINKFDQSKGMALSTYATYWIRAYMFKYMISVVSLLKFTPTTDEANLYFNLDKEKSKLSNQNIDVENDMELVAHYMNENVEKTKLINSFKNIKISSLDKYQGNLKDILIADNDNIPDKLIEERNSKIDLNSKLELFKNSLNDKEKEVFNSRIQTNDPITFEEIGGKLLISKQRAQQIEAEVKTKLTRFLRAKGFQVNCETL